MTCRSVIISGFLCLASEFRSQHSTALLDTAAMSGKALWEDKEQKAARRTKALKQTPPPIHTPAKLTKPRGTVAKLSFLLRDTRVSLSCAGKIAADQ